MTDYHTFMLKNLDRRTSALEKRQRQQGQAIADIRENMVTRKSVWVALGVIVPAGGVMLLVMFYVGERMWG